MPSDEPLPPETGAGSTNSPASSSTKLAETLLQLTEAEERLAQELELQAGVQRLGRLVTIKDMRQNLEAEAKAFARELEHDSGVVKTGDEADGEEEMDAMAGRDVIVEHHYHYGEKAAEAAVPTNQDLAAKPVAATTQVSASAPAAATSFPLRTVGWTLGKVAVGSLLAGTGLGVPVAITMAVLSALKPAPKTVINNAPPPAPTAPAPSDNPFIGFGITIGKPE